MPRPFELRWEGFPLAVGGRDGIYRQIFLDRSFEPAEFEYLRGFLRPGMTVIDCGANVGLYSLFASRMVGQAGAVVAIEASRREFVKLQSNIALNRASNIHALNIAAADGGGTLSFYIADEENAGHNTSDPRDFFWKHSLLERKEDVPSESLDTIAARLCLSRVDLIKMDIENGELAALRGAVQTLTTFRPVLLVEVADPAVADYLAQLGYRPEKPSGFVNSLFR